MEAVASQGDQLGCCAQVRFRSEQVNVPEVGGEPWEVTM